MPDYFGHEWPTFPFADIALADGWIVKHGHQPPSAEFVDLTGGGGGSWDPGPIIPDIGLIFESLPRVVAYKWSPVEKRQTRYVNGQIVNKIRGWRIYATIEWDAVTEFDMNLLKNIYFWAQFCGGDGRSMKFRLHAEDNFYFEAIAVGDFVPDYHDGMKPVFHKFKLDIMGAKLYKEPVHDFTGAPVD